MSDSKAFALNVQTESGRGYVIFSKPAKPAIFQVIVFDQDGTFCRNVTEARIQVCGAARSGTYVACRADLRDLTQGQSIKVTEVANSGGKSQNWKSTPIIEVKRFE